MIFPLFRSIWPLFQGRLPKRARIFDTFFCFRCAPSVRILSQNLVLDEILRQRSQAQSATVPPDRPMVKRGGSFELPPPARPCGPRPRASPLLKRQAGQLDASVRLAFLGASPPKTCPSSLGRGSCGLFLPSGWCQSTLLQYPQDLRVSVNRCYHSAGTTSQLAAKPYGAPGVPISFAAPPTATKVPDSSCRPKPHPRVDASKGARGNAQHRRHPLCWQEKA